MPHISSLDSDNEFGRAVTPEEREAVGFRASGMIQSFANRETGQLFRTGSSRRFAAISRVASRKLIQMNQARALSDLAVPPGNRLEALRGGLSGFHPIRINDQWRIVFRWTDEGPDEVAIVDYH